MSLLKSLINMFSTSQDKAGDPSAASEKEYKGFLIIASPAREGSQFRINGLIRKDEREHIFMRADILPTPELCAQETFRKAKLMIDQQGDNLFQ